MHFALALCWCRARLQSQVRRTEEYASKQHRQGSYQQSDSEDPEQVRFEGRVALDRSETRVKQLQVGVESIQLAVQLHEHWPDFSLMPFIFILGMLIGSK